MMRLLRGRTLAASLLSLGFTLAAAAPAFCQDPPRPGEGRGGREAPPDRGREPSLPRPTESRGEPSRRDGGQAEQIERARRKVEAYGREMNSLIEKMSEARRELATLEGHPPTSGFGGTGRSGFTPPARSGSAGGGTGGPGRPDFAPPARSSGMGGTTSGSGFGRSDGGSRASSSGTASRDASSSRELAEIKKEIAELRAIVNKLADTVNKNKR